MKTNKKNSNKFVELLKNNYYFLIVIVVLIIVVVFVPVINNKLNKSEQMLYNIIEEGKDTFKNPQSLKVVSAKICSDEYSIIRITANNSYGAETTDTYYVNKSIMSTEEPVSKAVAEKCFEEELNNYNSVVVLSKKSIEKVNNKLGVKK